MKGGHQCNLCVQDPTCGVWQHSDCLGYGVGRPPPRQFYCETCRAKLADPFWEPVDPHLLPPSRLKPQVRKGGLDQLVRSSTLVWERKWWW